MVTEINSFEQVRLNSIETEANDKTETFNFSQLMEEIILKYENSNISLSSKPRIYFDGRKNLITRCINNLLDNSLKYANKIEINLEKENTNLLISISDDGPGVPETEYKNIIKPFYKIDKSRSETKSSVGLGLAISSGIIKSHGGDIVFNKSDLGGLKVKIFLPV